MDLMGLGFYTIIVRPVFRTLDKCIKKSENGLTEKLQNISRNVLTEWVTREEVSMEIKKMVV